MDETLIQIEKYFSGQLNQNEMEAFENKRKTDKAFAQEVELYQDMMGGLRLRNNKLLKNRLNEIHKQEVEKSQEASIRPLLWKVAAAAACLLILISIFLIRGGSPNTNALYASNYSPFEPDWTTRSTTQDEAIIDQVKELYEAKQYDDLSQLLSVDSLQDKFTNVKFTMIKGIASLEDGRYIEARSFFETAGNNVLMKAEAQWYTALSYLKEGNTEKCIEILEQFKADKASDYYNEAVQLLKDL